MWKENLGTQASVHLKWASLNTGFTVLLKYIGCFRSDLDQDQWSTEDLSGSCASKEPMNPLWSLIHRFLWCTMIQTDLGSLILLQITPKEGTHRFLFFSFHIWLILISSTTILGFKSTFINGTFGALWWPTQSSTHSSTDTSPAGSAQ